MIRTLLLLLVIATCLAGPVWAQRDAKGVPWNQLSPDEQTALQRFSEKWDQFPPNKQERLLKGRAAGMR